MLSKEGELLRQKDFILGGALLIKKTLIKYAFIHSFENKWSNGRKHILSRIPLSSKPALFLLGLWSTSSTPALSPLARIKHAILLNYPCKQAPGRASDGEKSLQPLENKKLSFSTVLQIKMRGSFFPPSLPEYNEWRAQEWLETGIQQIKP